MDRHLQGIVLIAFSAASFSTAGLFTRLIQLDAWTVLFWRGVFAGFMILCIIISLEGRRTWAKIKSISIPGLAVAIGSAGSAILFIHAVQRTSVADVVIIFAAAPFVTAALGRLWFGTKESCTTLVASAAALLGVSILVAGSMTGGHLWGDVLAIGAMCYVAVVMLVLRRYRHTPMLTAAGLSALLCPVLVLPFAKPLEPSAAEMLYLFLFGTVQFGLGLVLFTVGGRWVSATENALISTLETPFAVAWVWLIFDEVPTPAAFAGGFIILMAVTAQIMNGSRSRLRVGAF